MDGTWFCALWQANLMGVVSKGLEIGFASSARDRRLCSPERINSLRLHLAAVLALLLVVIHLLSMLLRLRPLSVSPPFVIPQSVPVLSFSS